MNTQQGPSPRAHSIKT